ncbi:MAG: response regulator transcription factor [Chloroflexi bacterium]|nr:response regulator transcription factor [Chloroflexota bacterium]
MLTEINNKEKPEGESRRILVVDDDLKIAQFITSNLQARGYEVVKASDGEEALRVAVETTPNLMLLDLSLPKVEGLEVLRRLQPHRSFPIIILSALDDEASKIEALDLGADDYLTKPFGIGELLARLRVTFRRLENGFSPSFYHISSNQTTDISVVPNPEGLDPTGRYYRAGSIEVDLEGRVVKSNGKEVALTPTEYSLLHYLVTNAGKILTHRELLQKVWGPEYGGETEYLRTYIKQLRRKLEPEVTRPVYLLTIPSTGYRFRPPLLE